MDDVANKALKDPAVGISIAEYVQKMLDMKGVDIAVYETSGIKHSKAMGYPNKKYELEFKIHDSVSKRILGMAGKDGLGGFNCEASRVFIFYTPGEKAEVLYEHDIADVPFGRDACEGGCRAAGICPAYMAKAVGL